MLLDVAWGCMQALTWEANAWQKALSVLPFFLLNSHFFPVLPSAEGDPGRVESTGIIPVFFHMDWRLLGHVPLKEMR